MRRDYEEWGDKLGPKQEGMLRFGMQNFGGFSRNQNGKSSDEVEDSLRKWITDNEFDAFGMPECNVYWPAMRPHRNLHARVNEWFERDTTKCTYSYNSTGGSQRSALQWGGVAQIAMRRLAVRCRQSGRDPRNLGRWTWMSFQGSNNRTFFIYTAYRPVRGPGEFTTYQQQRRFLTEKTLRTRNPEWARKDPRDWLLDELADEIKERHNQDGSQVILHMDVNQDVRQERIQQFLTRAGLSNSLGRRHGLQDMPSTCLKASNQSKPIDGIFVTEGLGISRGGITGGGCGVTGRRADHRCLWIEIPFHILLGSPAVPLIRFPMRRVKTQDPRIVKEFNRLYNKELRRNHAHERMFALERKAGQGPITQDDRQEAEKLDRIKMQAIEFADRHCRKLRMGQVECSPEFQHAAAQVSAYCLLVKKKKRQKIGSRLLQRSLKKAKITESLKDLLRLSAQELIARRERAFEQYREVKKNDGHFRDSWIESLAQARVKESNSSKDLKQLTATELRTMRRTEKTRQSARRVKQALQTDPRQGTIMVQELNDHGETIEHTDKEAIERCCMAENKRRFSQTFDTPPLTAPLRQELGLLGDTEQGDAILHGQYQPHPQADHYSALLLKELQGEILQARSVGISTQEFQSGWKKMRERTSAGPSLLHFGHMKAIARHDGNSSFEASQISFAMKTGFSFTRWQKGIDVEILKKAGVWDVKKLRTIVLFEADFNFINKYLGRKSMRIAESRKTLAPEQYGSRKGHRASDHALNKWWTLDIIRQLKRPAALCSNDLKSCYDRIVHSIAALCLRRVGITKSETITMFSTLQRLRHVIRTAYGDSETSYGADNEHNPLQGIFQGNGGGPPMWATISSPVMEAIRKMGFGAQFCTAFENAMLEFLGYAFVDDTDLLESKGKSWEETAMDMQDFVATWEGLLRATGGALATEKCTWWLLDFEWDNQGDVKYKTQETTPAVLTAPDADGTFKTIPRKEAHETFESLGIHQRPDGNTEDEFQHLLDAAKSWGTKIRSARLNKEDTLYSLRAFAMPKLMYGCSVAPLDEDQCQKLTSTLMRSALSKAGFNRNFPRAIIHAPSGELGYEMPHLFTHSIASHAQTILRHGPTDSLSGRLLRATLTYAKAEMGMKGNLFGHDFEKWGPLLSPCWIKQVWQNLASTEVQIWEGSANPPLVHDDERTIMEVLASQDLPPKEFQRVNRCRIALRVTYWAELINYEGTWMLPGTLSPQHEFQRYGPTGCTEWPRIPQPTPEDWRIWRLRVRNAFQVRASGRLQNPLQGTWKVHHNSQSTAWINPSTGLSAYRRQDQSWQGFLPTGRSFNGARQLEPLPGLLTIEPYGDPNWTPCIIHTARFANRTIWVQHDLDQIDPAPGTPSTSDIHQLRAHLQQQPEEIKWACRQCSVQGSLQRVVEAIVQGTAIMSTDGSYKGDTGTGSYILSTHDGGDLLFGSNRSPGSPQLQCSLRSELSGICGGFALLQAIGQAIQVPTIQITLSCDNLEAGNQASSTATEIPQPRQEHFDLRRAVMYLRDRMGTKITTTFEHVRGHQDAHHTWEELSIEARLNCKADLLAKTRWEEERRTHPYLNALYPGEWRVIYQGVPIGSNLQRTLIQLVTTTNLRQWRDEKGKVENQWLGLWKPDTIQKALVPFTAQHRFLTKLAADFLPTGINMKKWKFWSHTVCPACGNIGEDGWHQFRCKDDRMRQAWMNGLSKFMETLRFIHTAPFIQHAFLSGMMRWRNQLDTPPVVGTAAEHQTEMGWNQILLGRIAQHWQELQTQWSMDKPLHIRRQTRAWIHRAARAAHQFSFSIWLHRNAILHDENQPFQKLREQTDDTDLRIAEEWFLGEHTLMPLDRHLLRGRSIEDLLNKPPATRRRWLTLIQTSRDAFQIQN